MRTEVNCHWSIVLICWAREANSGSAPIVSYPSEAVPYIIFLYIWSLPQYKVLTALQFVSVVGLTTLLLLLTQPQPEVHFCTWDIWNSGTNLLSVTLASTSPPLAACTSLNHTLCSSTTPTWRPLSSPPLLHRRESILMLGYVMRDMITWWCLWEDIRSW